MYKKLFGFTLAETLITLGIIGIVAAMTIPTLSVKIRGKRLQSQFKKTYSELNQAARAFYANTDMPLRDYSDNVYDGTWDSTKALRKFMSYFKGVQERDYGRDFDSNNNLKNLNLNNQQITSYPCDQSRAFTDLTGRIYTMDDIASSYDFDYGPKICVDINGVDKPNKWGVDRFVFVFTSNNSVVPYTGTSWNGLTAQQTDDSEIAKYCSTETETPVHTCAYFALNDKSPDGKGNYWYNFLKDK